MLPSIPYSAAPEGSRQVMEIDMNMTTSNGLNQTTQFPENSLTFNDFAPTLSQCFFIVLSSYLIGKARILKASDVRGVTAFAAYFAMPGIICVKLGDSDMRNIEWQLLVGTVLGKAVIYGAVAGCTMLLMQPVDLSTAAMLAMFCVQCNDLPVGNPLMSTLYGKKRPHMLKYLFLMPALTLVFFYPVTHIMIEKAKYKKKPLHKDIHRSSSRTSLYSKILRKMRLIVFHQITGEIILNLLRNPVLIATFCGFIMNLSYKTHVPDVVHQPINVVATMIPGLALSVLGLSMIGKEKHLLSSGVVLASVLIVVKMILTPLVLYCSVKAIVGDQHQEMLDFSLLYGIISPAAIVFQYGEKYRFPIAAMSAALIVSSFACFPLSFIIAKLSLDGDRDLNDYIPLLRLILFFVAAVSLVCSISFWVSFIWNKGWRKVPCWYIFYLTFTQVWMSIGVILWQIDDISFSWILRGQIALACGGEIMICFCVAALFVLLVIQQNDRATFGKYSVGVLVVASGLSAAFLIALCIHVFHHDLDRALLYGQPTFHYEYFQLEIETTVVSVSLVTGAISFIIYRKRKKSMKDFKDPVSIPLQVFADKTSVYTINLTTPESEDSAKRVSTVSAASTVTSCSEQVEKNLYYDEVVKTSQNGNVLVFGAEWTDRIISLMILLWVTMAVKFVANVLKLGDCKVSAMVIPLEYLQAVLFTGQGLWTFMICGVDIRTVFISIKKRWRRIWYGKEKPEKDFSPTEDEEAQKLCQQFQMFFYDQCFKEIAKERIWKKNHYQNSFWGHQMVNWLLKVGVAKDDLEAEDYGQQLLRGGLISHVRNAHKFLDAPYLYYFVKT